jgi:hypothetical protein
MRRYPRFVLLIEAAAAAPTTQPWWGIPAFTLGGAVLGAVTTQGFTVLNHRRKATDDKKAASEQLRREAVVDLLTAAHELMAANKAERMARSAEMYSCLMRLQLVLDGALLKASKEYYGSIHGLIKAAENGDKQKTDEAVQRQRNAQRAFVDAAREAHALLGLPPLLSP